MFLNPVQWPEKYFHFDSSSTSQGRWRLERAPWLADIMLAFIGKSGNLAAKGYRGLFAQRPEPRACEIAVINWRHNPNRLVREGWGEGAKSSRSIIAPSIVVLRLLKKVVVNAEMTAPGRTVHHV
jgi:hypothetical protein